MIVEILIFILTFLVAYFLYIHKQVKDKFSRADIKFLPGYPIFGNTLYSGGLGTKHIIEDIDAVYRQFPNEKYVGYIEATQPIILVRDPEIIKNITVKDFDHFVDHKQFFPEEIEPLFGGSVIMMKGDKWRDMRTTLSPAFTGSKMRQMMPFMTDISQTVISHLKKHHGDEEILNVGDLICRYTNDVIASAGFGIVVNSVEEKDNEFFKLGQGLLRFDGWQRFVSFLSLVCPKICKPLGITLFPKKTMDFFRNMVSSTIEYREKNNVDRPDMIQLLIEASKGKLKDNNTGKEKDSVGFAVVDEGLKQQGTIRKWTPDELTGQVFIFFVAGFESSGNTLVMCIHELALNPDIQERLYQEVREFKERNGQLTYDNIGELKYLDCVLNETMRKWAAAIIMDRTCTKAYELPPPREGGKPYRIEKGDIVYNVVNSIHMDSKYYPDPQRFDPDRFSDANKHNIKPFTYMPFGIGPRNCIGSRFAILELKVLLFDLVSNFEILKSEKTLDPIVLETKEFNVKCKGGSFVKLHKRA